MKNYKITIHFRYGNFEKDFEDIEVQTEDDEKAIEIAKKRRRFVFKVEINSVDEV